MNNKQYAGQHITHTHTHSLIRAITYAHRQILQITYNTVTWAHQEKYLQNGKYFKTGGKDRGK